MIKVINNNFTQDDIKQNKEIKEKYMVKLVNFIQDNYNSFTEFDMNFVDKLLYINKYTYINYSNSLIFNNDDKQVIFNLLFNNSINTTVEYLGMDNQYFVDKIKFMRKYGKNTINYEIIDSLFNDKYKDIIQYKKQYYKLCYIFLFYLGFQRRTIDYLQKYTHITNFNQFNEIKMGMISDIFIKYNVHYMYHTFNMDRFKNYKRFKIHLKNIYTNKHLYHHSEQDIYIAPDNSITEKGKGKKYTTFDCKILFTIPENFLNESLLAANKNNYIGNPNIFMYAQFILDNNKEIYVLPHANQPKLFGLGNIALTLDSMLYAFDLMSYCLYLLENETHFSKILDTRPLVEKKILTCTIIYYLFILLMPFREGNACISEIIFHSLFKKYINPNVIITLNPNVMLDIESLSLPFITFYNNCFQSDGTDTTPYFIINTNNQTINTPPTNDNIVTKNKVVNDLQPYISVIIATHKRYELLKRAVNSVLNQTYNNYQIIVVSDIIDSDTDNISTLLRSNDKYIVKDGIIGPADSRNIGISEALGNYIIFLDDDDEFRNTYFYDIVNFINSDKYNNEIIYTNSEHGNNGQITQNDISQIPINYIYIKNFITSNSLIYPYNWIKNKKFNNKLEYEDWEFIVSCIYNHNNIKYVPIYGPINHDTKDSRCKSQPDLLNMYIYLYKTYKVDNDEINKLRMQLLNIDTLQYNNLMSNMDDYDSVISKYVKYGLDANENNVNKCVFVCWFGGYLNKNSKMSLNRFGAFKSMIENIKIPIILITDNSYKSFEKSEYKIHEAFEYLSATHKSDYMRVYMLLHYGGGYSDIKYYTKSWDNLWNDEDWLNNDNLWIYGARELDPQWIGYPKGEQYIQQYYNDLITMNSIICKKNNHFIKELNNKINIILDSKLEKLKKYPGYNSGYYQNKLYDDIPNNQYPLRWSEIGGEIHHKLMYKYKDHIKYGLPRYELVNYR